MPGPVGLVTVLTAVTAVVATVAGLRLTARRRRAPRAMPGALVMFAIAWIAALGLPLALVDDLAVKAVILAVRLPGFGLLVAAVLWYAMLYAGQGARLGRRAAALLAIVPALLVVLAITAPWHDLVVTSIHPLETTGFSVVFGPAVWVHSAYSYVLLAVSAVLLVIGLRTAVTGHRWQYLVLLGTIALPVAGNLVTLSRAHTHGYLDLTSALLLVSTASWLWLERSRTAILQVPVSTPQVLRALGDAVIVVDAGGRVVMANPAAEEMIGPAGLRETAGLRPVGRLQGAHWSDIVDVEVWSDAWDGRRMTTAGGRVLDVRVTPVEPDGHATAWVVTARDVTDVEQLRAELAEQAVRDGLTGLHNRRYLDQVLADVVAEAHVTGRPLSAAMVDLDHFKAVNDQHGHAVGDAVLERIAAELGRCVRSDDVLVRFGGEEFLVLLPGAGVDVVRDRAESCRVRLGSLTVPTSAGPVRVTVSVGVASLEPGASGDALLRAADDALYAAKAGGRDRVVVAAPGHAVAGPDRWV